MTPVFVLSLSDVIGLTVIGSMLFLFLLWLLAHGVVWVWRRLMPRGKW